MALPLLSVPISLIAKTRWKIQSVTDVPCVIVSSDRHTHSMSCGLIITILMRALCVIVCLLL